jgi:hypothetical protein
MAIAKGHRFEIDFDAAFPMDLVMVGKIAPDNEYQSREDRSAGRPVRQRVDEVTGKRQWKAAVTDPSETNSKRASYDVTFLADVQPVPTTSEVLPGMRPIELEGLRSTPATSTSTVINRCLRTTHGPPAALRQETTGGPWPTPTRSRCRRTRSPATPPRRTRTRAHPQRRHATRTCSS